MSLLDNIIKYIKGGYQEKAPEGVCAICWGHQEYDNQIREIVKDQQIDVSGGREKYNFIQDFVVNHVDGIKLKNTINGLECPKCKTVQ